MAQCAIVLIELSPRGESLESGGAVDAAHAVICCVHPVNPEHADVGQGVTDGGDLPVEDGHDLALVGEHDVVETVVTVDDADGLSCRHVCTQRFANVKHRVDEIGVKGNHRGDLFEPSFELSAEVGVRIRHHGESECRWIKAVQLGEGGDEVGANDLASRDRDRAGLFVITEDETLGFVHEVERGSDEGGVVTEGKRSWDGKACGCQRREKAELSSHVVGRREHHGGRRSTQDHRFAGLILDAVGEVGATTWAELDSECSRELAELPDPGEGGLGKWRLMVGHLLMVLEVIDQVWSTRWSVTHQVE